jgi:hypothetical protein
MGTTHCLELEVKDYLDHRTLASVLLGVDVQPGDFQYYLYDEDTEGFESHVFGIYIRNPPYCRSTPLGFTSDIQVLFAGRDYRRIYNCIRRLIKHFPCNLSFFYEDSEEPILMHLNGTLLLNSNPDWPLEAEGLEIFRDTPYEWHYFGKSPEGE